jgi:5-methyltetrahydropteroyltriglutamate--homocysteine methyltransferase
VSRLKYFPTQEVGSLLRAPFLRKKIDDAVISETQYWGSLLGVENYQKLVEKIQKGDYSQAELQDWAALYAIRFHEAAGLDVVWDGEQRRVEMYEHALRHVSGVEFLGKVKVWDAETYNKAAVKSRPALTHNPYINEFLFVKSNARREIKVPLTGPYTLAEWSFDEYYAPKAAGLGSPSEARKAAKREMVLDFAREILRPVVASLIELGANRIQIDEPAATTKPTEVPLFVEAFNEIARGLNVRFTIHICYSDYKLLFPHILEAEAQEISIECANKDTTRPGQRPEDRSGYEAVKLFKEYSSGLSIAAGVTDVHTDFVEPPQLVKDRLLYVAKILGDPSKVVACHDCGLRTRRWEVAFKKEKSLVEGAEMARQSLA